MKKKLDLLFIVGHILTILYAYFLGWWALLMIFFAILLFHAAHGAFAHRIFTHDVDKSSSKLSNRAHWIGHFLFNMCGWGSALSFGSIHRIHHKHSGTELDPHEPKIVGKWNLFIGNYCLSADKRFFKIKYKSPYAAWFHKNYFKIAWIGMPFFAPVFAVGFWMRYLLLVVVHPDHENSPETAKDRWWLWPILLGDETHELHHKRSYLSKHHNLDFVYLCVKIWQII